MDIIEGELNLGLTEYNKPKRGNKDRRFSQMMEMANLTYEELGIKDDGGWEGEIPDFAEAGFEPAPWIAPEDGEPLEDIVERILTLL